MSNIKERVLQIAEYNGVSKTDFFKDLELSYANFKGAQKMTALNSDAVASILSRYPDVEPEWLVTGNGPMLRQGGNIVRDEVALYQDGGMPSENEPGLIDALKQVIASQEKTILALEGQVMILKEERKRL